MSDLLYDLALPRTDAGAVVQVVTAVPLFGVALWLARRRREVRTLVAGLGTITLAWFALRAMH